MLTKRIKIRKGKNLLYEGSKSTKAIDVLELMDLR